MNMHPVWPVVTEYHKIKGNINRTGSAIKNKNGIIKINEYEKAVNDSTALVTAIHASKSPYSAFFLILFVGVPVTVVFDVLSYAIQRSAAGNSPTKKNP